MPVRKHRSVKFFFVFSAAATLLLTLSAVSAHQPAANALNSDHQEYLPVLLGSVPAAAEPAEDDLINRLRANSGVPRVSYSQLLERNCFEHARYMAENGILTHEQDPSDPYASTRGQDCAEQANVWLATGTPAQGWNSDDAVMNWMSSVPHRAWLLYPTSNEFGLGFYVSQDDDHAGAALDVLSRAHFDVDQRFSGWPVRYPGKGEKRIPATKYPITLNWRYFGPEPVLKSTSLATASGTNIPHAASTQIAVGHKGIQIIPKVNLPANSKIKVSVSGSYEGAPFTYSWSFYTGSAPYASSTMEAIIGE